MNRASLALALAVALGALWGAACSEPSTGSTIQLAFDRPVDVAFGCYGDMRVTGGRPTADPADMLIRSAQPASACDLRSREPAEVPPGQGPQDGANLEVEWFAFVLQSTPGSLVVAHWAPATPANLGTTFINDSNELAPGNNSISVGEEPIAIATDKTGCYAVTANSGSCDLSALEINSAVDRGDPPTPAKVDRVTVANAAGTPILARPAAMLVEPNIDVVGNQCPASPSGLAYIAYPACHLVAAVDLSSGRMVAGIKFDATGVRITDGNEICPVECALPGGQLGAIDRNPPRPVTLSLDVATRRLAIGSDNAAQVTVVDLDMTSFRPTATTLQIPLARNNPTEALGVTSIAVSPVIAMGGTGTDARGGLAQYVYAVSTDGTVRVADVHRGNPNRECDTQIDLRFAREPGKAESSLPTLQCVPINDPAFPRRSGAKGPGIELVSNGVPLSVGFFTMPRPPLAMGEMTPARSTLSGTFAIITASNGATHFVNIDDDYAADTFDVNNPVLRSPVLVLPHQLRDVGNNRGGRQTAQGDSVPCTDPGPADLNSAGPRATTAPVRNVGAGPIASTKVDQMPFIRQVRCGSTAPVSEVVYAAPTPTLDAVFPDLRSLRNNETWTVTWEGSLSLDTALPIDGPPIRSGRLRVDGAGIHLVDQAKPFCELGVEPFDIVQLRGCNPANGNFECPMGYECFLHPESELGMGACLQSDEAERLANLCRDFLISGRRYTVASSRTGELNLLPRKRVLRTTPVDGCADTAQCMALADLAVRTANPEHPSLLGAVRDSHQWECRVDEARRQDPDPAKKRCIQVCSTNADCDVEDDELNRRFGVARFNMVCEGATADRMGVCMESVMPPAQCINGPQRYDVRAGEAFTVVGSNSGYVHSIVAAPDGTCVRPAPAPNVPNVQVGRIPLAPPPCAAPGTVDPITGRLTAGGFEANPCSLTAAHAENSRPYMPGTCTPGTSELVDRDAPAIQFRNRGLKLTLVDPTYPGDSACILDRQGGLGRVPLVYQGYQLSFHQVAGYTPMQLVLIPPPAFPVKIVRGPSESIWILDDGDFLATAPGSISTRGRVYRIEVSDLAKVTTLQ